MTIEKMAEAEIEKAWFSCIVEIMKDSHVHVQREIKEIELDVQLISVLNSTENIDSTVVSISCGNSVDNINVTLPNNATASVPFNFGYKFVKFKLNANSTTLDTKQTAGLTAHQSAFDVMNIARRAETHLPVKRKGQTSNDRFFNDLLTILSKELDVGFRIDQVDTLGKKITQTLYKCLWYIEPHHRTIEERGIHIPKPFTTLKEYYNYRHAHKPQPRISSPVLKQHLDDLSDILLLTYTGKHAKFFAAIRDLVDCIKKYHVYLERHQGRTKFLHHSEEPLRSKENDFTLKTIPAISPVTVHNQYLELDEKLREASIYSVIWLNDLPSIPNDRYVRRHWIDDLALSVPIQMYSYEHGNNLGTYRFVWRLPVSDDERTQEKTLKVVSDIHKSLPSYHTRNMKKLFFDRYGKIANINRSVLRDMYRYLTDCELPDASASQDIDKRLKLFLLSDDTDILWDLRKQNGNPGSTKFDIFWDEINKYFEENTPAVQERRHGQHLYLPFAVSVEDLVSTIASRLPSDVAIPSAEWVRLQFWPSDPTTIRAIHHTGRLNIKFAVQSRQMRGSHEDSSYCYYQLKLVKAFAIHWRENILLFWLDDKAVVPIGEPDKPISATGRSHNRAIVPAGPGVKLNALDHDFHLCGAIPSAVLKSDIPESTADTFFRGDVFVTVKDKVFQPSNTWRHSTEMVKLVRGVYSEDGVNAAAPIIIHYTDGGPDHRTTFTSVQLASVAQFILLDLDLFAAVRTAPMGSWANLAERVNSILNLGLQHVSLARESMTEDFEKSMTRVKTLKDARRLSERNPAFKTALESSVAPVIETIESRFAKLKLKGEGFQVLKPATVEEVEDFFSILYILDDKLDQSKVCKKDVQDSERISQFFEKHCCSRNYMFQIKKCPLSEKDNCWYCTLNPPRLPPELYASLHPIPDPVLDEKNKSEYLPFSEVYGKDTTEKDRPSKQSSNVQCERDNTRKSLLVGTKVRGKIMCVDCQKPRVVYSSKKLSVQENTAVENVRQENVYTCGSPLFSDTSNFCDNIVVRESLRCNSPIEVTYYSGKTHKFTDVCIHCGDLNNLSMDEGILSLKRSFTTVRPICTHCFRKGKEPVCRGPKNVGKRQKRN